MAQYTPWNPAMSEGVVSIAKAHLSHLERGKGHLTGFHRVDAQGVLRTQAGHYCHEGLGVVGDLLRQAQLVELLDHDVLEDGTSNRHANRHAQGTHEGVHGSSPAGVLDAAYGLDSDIDAC
jgi:hypothetical protein